MNDLFYAFKNLFCYIIRFSKIVLERLDKLEKRIDNLEKKSRDKKIPAVIAILRRSEAWLELRPYRWL